MKGKRSFAASAAFVLTWAASGAAQEAQYVSPAGQKYYPQQDDKNLVAEAQKKLDADPKNVDLLIALGDAYGTVWNHKAAIAVYDKAFQLAPGKPVLYQQRGHRYLSIREFRKARTDLEEAVKLDATLAGAWYYLGLLRYLDADFAGAAAAYAKNVSLADKFEAAIGGVDWQYMSLRRAKKDAEAAALLAKVTPDLKIEGSATIYFNRTLFYKGLKKEAELFTGTLEDIQVATLSYGVGNWHFYSGHLAEAKKYFEKTVGTTAWPALAFIASEVELKRMGARH